MPDSGSLPLSLVAGSSFPLDGLMTFLLVIVFLFSVLCGYMARSYQYGKLMQKAKPAVLASLDEKELRLELRKRLRLQNKNLVLVDINKETQEEL